MDYYDTTPEQVQRVSAELGMATSLVHALLEGGNTPEQIRAMPPQERFNGYCTWHGLIGWGSNLIAAATAAGVCINPQLGVKPPAGPLGNTVWVGRGEVDNLEAWPEGTVLGQDEWQFSDGPVGNRGYSEDYLTLQEGLAAHSGKVIIWEPE